MKEAVANEVDSRNETKNDENLEATSKNKEIKLRKIGKKKMALQMNCKKSNAVPRIQVKLER